MTRVSRFLSWLESNTDTYDGLLLDIDGTLIRGERALHGAQELIAWLESVSCPYLLVTNDANHSHEEKAATLRTTGLPIGPKTILSSGDVIAKAVREKNLLGSTFFVMGDLGKPDYAEEAGVVVTRDCSALDRCAGIIVGEGDHDWQSSFDAAVNFFIANPQAPFIAPNPDIYWPEGDGKIAIAAGAKAQFIASVLAEYGVSITPEYLGKPYTEVFEYARLLLAEQLGKPSESADRIIMVGDSLMGDIRGANRAGFMSVLVLTGITPEDQLSRAVSDLELQPDLLAENL